MSPRSLGSGTPPDPEGCAEGGALLAVAVATGEAPAVTVTVTVAVELEAAVTVTVTPPPAPAPLADELEFVAELESVAESAVSPFDCFQMK